MIRVSQLKLPVEHNEFKNKKRSDQKASDRKKIN